MLTFTDRQLAALFAPDDATAAARIRNALIRKHGRAVARMPDDRLAEVIVAGVRRARTYGLRQMDSLMLFVVLMLEVAPGFDREPAIAAYLAASGDAPDARMLDITTAVAGPAWQAAAALQDEAEWSRTTGGDR
jgi:hypothetical protein